MRICADWNMCLFYYGVSAETIWMRIMKLGYVCTWEQTEEVVEDIYLSGTTACPNYYYFRQKTNIWGGTIDDSKWYQIFSRHNLSQLVLLEHPCRGIWLGVSRCLRDFFRQGKRDYWPLWCTCRGIKVHLASLYRGAVFMVVESKFCFPVDLACHNIHKHNIWEWK